MKQKGFTLDAGQALVELLVAIGIATILLPALLTGFVASREGKAQGRQRADAVAILVEAREAVRIVRDRGWTEFAVNGTFHPVVLGSTWVLSAGGETVSGFTRSIAISDVLRDANGVIVSSGGSVDPSTKQVAITVSWNSPLPSDVSDTFYLTRFTNRIFVQTTKADFTAGTKTNVIVTDTDGGEVTLAAGGRADWCGPNLSITPLDLPKSGVANAITAIEGRVFAGTGENASGISFANIGISNTNPPAAAVLGTFDGYKTNGIFGETNYAYLATDNNFKEIVIINLTSTPYTEVGYFNAPGNGNGNSIFVAGVVGYMTSGNTLYTFDLTSQTGSRPQLGSVTLAATGKEIVVVGQYAYVAIDATNTQLQIIDVSDPRNLAISGTASVSGGKGKDVFVDTSGTRAYLVTETSVAEREFFIIDISTKTGSRPTVGSYDANGMDPKGITVAPGNRAIVVGTGAEEYQVVDISTESVPVRCGGLNIDTGINGVSSVNEGDGDAYSYVITGDSSSELKIIEGGPGGGAVLSGVFESSAFDATMAAMFNRFDPNAILPSQTNITYQVSSADAVMDSCSGVSFSFVGPDGTSNTFFATGSAIPFSATGSYKNPSRCFVYRAYLTSSDSAYAPIFTDITVSYSP
ncbi:hypothetical protein HYV22_02425 [Candidatus Gottesmanbacteria bacterium]|nr:hypothetical protein [Candidatus Gottesmanbacteria bacterium]